MLYLWWISVPILVVAAFVSFFRGSLLIVHLWCLVSSFGCSRILVAGLTQVSALFLLLCCSVFHVSIFVHDDSLLNLTGVFDWLGDISHLVRGILLISCRISECIPLLLLGLLHFWTRNICWGLVLYSFRLSWPVRHSFQVPQSFTCSLLASRGTWIFKLRYII